MIVPMNLATEGNTVEVKSISMKDGLNKRLGELGIISGNKIKIIKNDGRSLIISIEDSRFALDNNIAKNIMIAT
ncbi:MULTISPECIES: FeoA family protein [Clostridium]|uniref:Ferrous iron transport protein A n=1 Tax=Clostridium senegalense TaxID=1465809 RepID=A0A6M0H7N1_9CLOT|nr:MULTISPECIES: FeoA family protein [Clostridium]MBU5227073.1 ferrous iron transport protein A [Clostridium senegalense]NEU06378.1 ferrous iron transport protein A [Clostridium senegalense]